MAPARSLYREQVAFAIDKFRKGRASARPISLGKIQQQSRIDRGPSPGTIACPVTIPKPQENDVAAKVMAAVKGLGESDGVSLPQTGHLAAEWVGRCSKDLKTGDLSPRERYEILERNAKSSAVTIFMHGGGYL